MALRRSDKEFIPLAGAWKYKLGLGLGEAPELPVNTATEPNYPTFLYNAMIHPLVGYGIRGAIWYQGEANVARAAQYRDLLPLMIRDWRRQWGYDFPFYIVQLANYMKAQEGPEESGGPSCARRRPRRSIWRTRGWPSSSTSARRRTSTRRTSPRWGGVSRSSPGRRPTASGSPIRVPLRVLHAGRRRDPHPFLAYGRRTEDRGRRSGRGLLDRRRRPPLPRGEGRDRGRRGGRIVGRGGLPRGRALRLGEQSRLQPLQRRGASGRTVPHGRLDERREALLTVFSRGAGGAVRTSGLFVRPGRIHSRAAQDRGGHGPAAILASGRFRIFPRRMRGAVPEKSPIFVRTSPCV